MAEAPGAALPELGELLDRLREELEAHLDGEEEALLPVLSALSPG